MGGRGLRGGRAKVAVARGWDGARDATLYGKRVTSVRHKRVKSARREMRRAALRGRAWCARAGVAGGRGGCAKAWGKGVGNARRAPRPQARGAFGAFDEVPAERC